MDSLSHLHAITALSDDDAGRPHRLTVSKKKWRQQALARLQALAERAGLNHPKLLKLAGVCSLDDLSLSAISALTDELGSYGRQVWE